MATTKEALISQLVKTISSLYSLRLQKEAELVSVKATTAQYEIAVNSINAQYNALPSNSPAKSLLGSTLTQKRNELLNYKNNIIPQREAEIMQIQSDYEKAQDDLSQLQQTIFTPEEIELSEKKVAEEKAKIENNISKLNEEKAASGSGGSASGVGSAQVGEKSKKILYIVLAVIVLAAITGITVYFLKKSSKK